MRGSIVASLIVAAGLLAAGAGDAAAQPRPYNRPYRPYYYGHPQVYLWPRGLYVGGGAVATRILDQRGGNELLDDGGGITLFTGVRVNQALALELGWTGTFHNPERVATSFGSDVDYLVLNAFTGDAKIYLGTDAGSVEPYLQGGLGLYLLDSTYFGTQSVGTGFQLGGGLDFLAGGSVKLGLRALYRGIAMGPPDANTDDTFISAATVEGNLTIQF